MKGVFGNKKKSNTDLLGLERWPLPIDLLAYCVRLCFTSSAAANSMDALLSSTFSAYMIPIWTLKLTIVRPMNKVCDFCDDPVVQG